MTNPTRQEIIRAYGTLSFLWDCLEVGWKLGASTIESSKSNIEKVLPPRPQPTMAEVEWDDDKHYLAEAEHVDWGTVVMLYYDGQSNRIQYFCKLDEPNMVVYSDPANLTPTGKRYTLTEVQDNE